MGTSLTGTKPKDTYDSLIKVTDNGPLDPTTAKYLSDGLGNDSPLALSQAAVGIGTSAPSVKLQVVANDGAAGGLAASVIRQDGAAGNNGLVVDVTNTPDQYIADFRLANSSIARVTANGLTFNGDTAAANALDDYEEGTFTATLKGSTTDPTTPVTTTANYTKIGRQVTVSFAFTAVNTTGAAGAVSVSGLPFTIGSNSVGAVLSELFDFGGTRTSIGSFAGAGGSIIFFFATGDDATFDNLVHNAGTGRYLWTTVTYFV